MVKPHDVSDRAQLIRLSGKHAVALTRFLELLSVNGDGEFFHPHALDAAGAQRVVFLSESGRDEYWAAVNGEDFLAYGMLRGWDEGYEVPSLGLAVNPVFRGCGLARKMMSHLHNRATQRGAKRVRLKVDRRNIAALALYVSLGYHFDDGTITELVGYCDLSGTP